MNVLDRCRTLMAEGFSDVAAAILCHVESRQTRKSAKTAMQVDEPQAELLWRFIEEHCHAIPGAWVTLKDFYERFEKSFGRGVYMTKGRVVELIRERYPYGAMDGGTRTIGDLTFNAAHQPGRPIIQRGDRLLRGRKRTLARTV